MQQLIKGSNATFFDGPLKPVLLLNDLVFGQHCYHIYLTVLINNFRNTNVGKYRYLNSQIMQYTLGSKTGNQSPDDTKG